MANVYKPNGRRYYIVRFRFNGKLIQKRTRATSRKDAADIAAQIRSELAKGNFGILEKKAAPLLAEFLKEEFGPYNEAGCKAEPKTLDYYRYGVRMLTNSDMASLPLDKITDQHARGFEAHNSHLKASTINCGLRTLRRALNLALDWGKIDRKPKIALAKNEARRDRVLSKEEAIAYLAACPQPWRDVATLILGTGARPEEARSLRWELVQWRDGGGVIHMPRGKTAASVRPLPLFPEVYSALLARHQAQGCPAEGPVFPSESARGYLTQGSDKNQHAKALATLAEAHTKDPKANIELKPFAPYTLRHTGLTWIAPYTDAYTLARIAGHTSISMTMRYIHPSAGSIEQAFLNAAEHSRDVYQGVYQTKLLESSNSPSVETSKMESKG
jgi:integrase